MSALEVGSRTLDWGARTYIMGVVNVSPESFSGDGLADPKAAAALALRLVEKGADLIDLGGQSTRPGSSELEEDIELARLLSAITAIREAVDVPISVDTYRSRVVEACLESGADMVNDIHGLLKDERAAQLVAQYDVPVVLMHNQRHKPPVEVIAGVRAGLLTSLENAYSNGIRQEHIILDPGFGFGWSVEQNLEMLRRLAEIKELGFPLLVGTSRKSTIGAVLDQPESGRIWGTAATIAIAIARGADIVRVHDVGEMAQVARMVDAIVRSAQ